jgi:two-component sensor histidine kinase
VGSVWDRNDVLIARSRNHDQFVGTKLPDRFREARPQGTSVFKTTNLDGEKIILANTTSKISDWRVAVSVPVAIAEAPLRSSLWWWGGAAIFAMLAAGSLAVVFGNLLERPLVAAAATARAFGRGEPIALARTRLREVDEVTGALREASDRQKLLISELSHRVKNLLAVVHALMARSVTDERTPAEGRELFAQRLQALSRAHGTLVESNWRGGALRDIIAAELAPFSERVELAGPQLLLAPNIVQSLTLVLHELATNAAKYGSLSVPDGSLRVTWKVARTDAGERFQLEWQERDGPKVEPPTSKGFGTTLLETAFPNGQYQLLYQPDGFVYELDTPLDVIGAGKHG